MAIVGINPVSRPSQPQKPREQSDLEKLVMGLQAAQSAFGIYADYTKLGADQAANENAETENQIKQAQLAEMQNVQAGRHTPSSLSEKGFVPVPEGLQPRFGQGAVDRQTGFSTAGETFPVGTSMNVTTREGGGDVTRPQQMIHQDLLKQLNAMSPEQQAQFLSSGKRNLDDRIKETDLAMKEINLKNKEDERQFFESQDTLMRNIKNSSDRKSLAKTANAYSTLTDLGQALEGDIPLNRAIGDNLATAARARFVQFFGREFSGAAIADNAGVMSFLDLTTGAERQQFEKLVPSMGDDVATARTKIDQMKILLERYAIGVGAPTTDEFVNFVNRTGREVRPLSRTPRSMFTESMSGSEPTKANRGNISGDDEDSLLDSMYDRILNQFDKKGK
ncbi:hypothetical protein N8Z24_00675 [bacterium]|nr:hypothetical protein [bacterium]